MRQSDSTVLRHEPQYQDVLYGGWFDTLTIILWPGAFYLSIMVAKEPLKVTVVVWSIAILFNPIIYGFIGWVIWRLSKPVNLAQG